MPRVYASSSGQLKHNLYPTSEVAPGFSAMQHIDLIQDDSDRGSSPLGLSSSKLGPNDGVIQPAVEISTIVPPFASTITSPELHIPETSTVSKDIGEFVQSSPRTPGAECMGTALVELSLSTGDALDKYQVWHRRWNWQIKLTVCAYVCSLGYSGEKFPFDQDHIDKKSIFGEDIHIMRFFVGYF